MGTLLRTSWGHPGTLQQLLRNMLLSHALQDVTKDGEHARRSGGENVDEKTVNFLAVASRLAAEDVHVVSGQEIHLQETTDEQIAEIKSLGKIHVVTPQDSPRFIV